MTYNIKLDNETLDNIVVQVLTKSLDGEHLPEGREIEYALACQEVLHFFMIPAEWEKRFERDFVEYSTGEKNED